ncbi:MAG: ABC transporter permease [Candidatus Sumerlaeia bacterium]|nr:ABC transporter permease [Candidatus Sumerlaeia bacterium]
MTIRRIDIAAWAGLIVLAHVLLVSRWVEPFVNAAFCVVNLYFVFYGLLLIQWRREAGRTVGLYTLGYLAGYVALIWLCFVYNRQWQPRFFLYAVPYITLFRLPLGLILLALFIASSLIGQAFALQMFAALAAIAVMLHEVWRTRRDWFVTALLAFGALAFGLFLFPVFCLATTDTPQTLLDVFRRPEVRQAIGVSLLSATAAAAVTVIFGVPFAWALARSQFRGKPLVETLIDVPILIPHSAVGVAYLLLFGDKAVWGEALRLSGTFWGIVAVQVFVSAPFLIKTVYQAFDAMGTGYETTARTLGASAAGAFVRVALPLGARAIAIGAILSWARAVSEVGSVELFAYYPMTAPILIATRTSQMGLAQARPIAVLLVLTCLFIFLALQLGRSVAAKPFLRKSE